MPHFNKTQKQHKQQGQRNHPEDGPQRIGQEQSGRNAESSRQLNGAGCSHQPVVAGTTKQFEITGGWVRYIGQKKAKGRCEHQA